MQRASVFGNAIGPTIGPKATLMDTAAQYDELMWARSGAGGRGAVGAAAYAAGPPGYVDGGPVPIGGYASGAPQPFSGGGQEVSGAKGAGAPVLHCYPNGVLTSPGAGDYSPRPANFHLRDAQGGNDFGSTNGGVANAVQVAAAAVAAASATAQVDHGQQYHHGYPTSSAQQQYSQQQQQMYATQQQQQYSNNVVANVQPPSYGTQPRVVQSAMMQRHPMAGVRPHAVDQSMIRYASAVQSTACLTPRQRMMNVQSTHYATSVSSSAHSLDPNVDISVYGNQSVNAPPYARYPPSQMARTPPAAMCYPGANGALPAMAPKGVGNSYSTLPGYGQATQAQSAAYQPAQMVPSNQHHQPYAYGPMTVSNGAYAEVKPMVAAQSNDDAEPRMSFPVKDGMLLQPFRLEHNIPVSQITFFIQPEQLSMLCADADLDVQLKCFHAEDRFMCNNWPHNASIQIVVNDAPVIVGHVDRPLYVKRLCQPNKNVLQIAVQQCCCSHLFMLSLVSRPHVDRVLSNLVRRKLLPVEMAIEKIRRSFAAADVAGQPLSDVEHLSTTVSLKCPFTMTKMSLPARCQDCRHIQCFDLKSFLMINKERPHWQCPICARPTNVENLEIDQYIWGILTNLAKCPDVADVSIDSTASWKAHGPPMVRSDGQYMSCNPPKRVKVEGGDASALCGWSQSAPAARVQTERVSSNVTGQLEIKTAPQQQVGKKHHYVSDRFASQLSQLASVRSPYQTTTVQGDAMTQQMLKYGPPTPATPLANPPSVGGCGEPRSVGNPPSVEGNNPLVGGGHAQTSVQLSVDGNPTGSAPYTPASVGSSGSQQGSHSVNAASNEACNQELNDLAFDAADLLPSDGASDNLGNFFTDSTMPDPGEFIQYFESSNFGEFGLSVVDRDDNVGGAEVKSARQDMKETKKVSAISTGDVEDILSMLGN